MSKLAVRRAGDSAPADAVPAAGCCVIQDPVGQIAAQLGISCQRVFELAYQNEGESYGRAVFILYVDTNRVAVPPRVVRFGEKTSRARRNCVSYCVGCKLSLKQWAGLVSSYRMIHPEVTRETLLGQVKEKAKPRVVKSYDDKLFEAFEEAGALMIEDIDLHE